MKASGCCETWLGLVPLWQHPVLAYALPLKAHEIHYSISCYLFWSHMLFWGGDFCSVWRVANIYVEPALEVNVDRYVSICLKFVNYKIHLLNAHLSYNRSMNAKFLLILFQYLEEVPRIMRNVALATSKNSPAWWSNDFAIPLPVPACKNPNLLISQPQEQTKQHISHMMTVGNRRRPNAKAYGHEDRVRFITVQPTEMNHINTLNEDHDEKIYTWKQPLP